MSYIQQAYKGFHDGWRYIIGTVIIFIFWQFIGMLPLGIAIAVKVIGGATFTEDIAGMSALLGSNLFLFLMLISFATGLVGVFFSSKLLHQLSFKQLTTTRQKVDWSRFWFIFCLWGFLSVSLTLFGYYMQPENYVLNFQLDKFLVLAVIAIVLIPIQTSFEEYLFRGYLMQGLGVVFKNKWIPLLLTSVGFGLMHIVNPEVDAVGPVIMIFYIGTGLVLGIMTLMDDGLELALGFHAANNLFIALLVTTDWTALQTHSILKDMTPPETMALSEIIVPVFVLFPIILLILSKKYEWTNWKTQLFGKIEPPIKDDYKIIDEA